MAEKKSPSADATDSFELKTMSTDVESSNKNSQFSLSPPRSRAPSPSIPSRSVLSYIAICTTSCLTMAVIFIILTYTLGHPPITPCSVPPTPESNHPLAFPYKNLPKFMDPKQMETYRQAATYFLKVRNNFQNYLADFDCFMDESSLVHNSQIHLLPLPHSRQMAVTHHNNSAFGPWEGSHQISQCSPAGHTVQLENNSRSPKNSTLVTPWDVATPGNGGTISAASPDSPKHRSKRDTLGNTTLPSSNHTFTRNFERDYETASYAFEKSSVVFTGSTFGHINLDLSFVDLFSHFGAIFTLKERLILQPIVLEQGQAEGQAPSESSSLFSKLIESDLQHLQSEFLDIIAIFSADNFDWAVQELRALATMARGSFLDAQREARGDPDDDNTQFSDLPLANFTRLKFPNTVQAARAVLKRFSASRRAIGAQAYTPAQVKLLNTFDVNWQQFADIDILDYSRNLAQLWDHAGSSGPFLDVSHFLTKPIFPKTPPLPNAPKTPQKRRSRRATANLSLHDLLTRAHDRFPQNSFMKPPNPQTSHLTPSTETLHNLIDRSHERYHNNLETITLHQPVINYIHNASANPTLSRPPRAAALAGASLIVSTIALIVGASTLFGQYSDDELTKINQQIDLISQKQSQVISTINAIGTETTTNSLRIKQLQDYVSKNWDLLSSNKLELSNLCLSFYTSHLAAELRRELARYRSILATAANQRVSPQVMNLEQARLVLADLIKKSHKVGSVPIFDDPTLLYQLRTSLVKRKHGARVILHIPLCNTKSTMNLYRFSSLPIPLTDNPYGIRRASRHPEPVLHIRPPHTLLLENKDLHLSISMDDLQACIAYGKAYFCPKITTLKRADAPTCLYALFHSNFHLASQLCDFEIRQAQSAVMPLSSDYYRVFTPSATTRSANVTCAGGRSEPGSQLKEYSILKVPENCVVEIPGYLLMSKSEIYLDSKVKIHSFETQRQMVRTLNLSAITNYLQLASRRRRSPSLLLEQAMENPVFQKLEPVARVNHAIRHAGLIVGGVAILILAILGYCLYRYYQNYIKPASPAPPQPASQPLLPLQPSVQVNLTGGPDPAAALDSYRQTPPPRYPEVLPPSGATSGFHYSSLTPPHRLHLSGPATTGPPSHSDKPFATPTGLPDQRPLQPPPFRDCHPPLPPATTTPTDARPPQ